MYWEWYFVPYTRHTSSCRRVGFPRSPQSLTRVSSWGFSASPPSCNSNYLGYRPVTKSARRLSQR
ncbi:hypothetical protein DNK66_11470 [Klebsiella aerogenes]|nr:hypothetical protein DNK66_11470 [Klebsiella aerogenes]